jgi:predicted nucleic acid-binding protein
MRSVFADTGYWIALVNPNDELHDKALAAGGQLGPCKIVTSDMVLTELLNAFADKGLDARKIAFEAVEAIRDDARIEVVPQTRRLFQSAFELYGKRPDKGWSLTDCASFVIMKERTINEALAHDKHFEQNGFVALLREVAC